MADELLVGIVRRPHGLRGELSVQPLTDFPERFAAGSVVTWRRGDASRELRVAAARPHGERILIAFEGVGDADAARALQDGELSIPGAGATPPPDGFFYAHEVAGWECVDPSGRRLGVAAGLEKTPGGALLSVTRDGGKEALVPFVHGIVVDVDRERRRIVLDPPEGLMEL
ncbi:MAG TPA: ribosome maturation factor RimM [Thermoanaerobaculia bacterium]|jgi:16S rRNA processing protein RimM|nr:ribosome maturation factor RimM [Thermoanaerobaculia bacterium]